jgi:hypothetical protein
MLFSSYTQYFIHPLTFTCHHRLKGLWYLRPCPRRSNDLRGSGIINPASTAAMTRGVSTSSIPPPSQQRLEGPSHHRLHLRHYPSLNNSSSAILTAREAVPLPSPSSTPPSQARHHHNLLQPCDKFPS